MLNASPWVVDGARPEAAARFTRPPVGAEWQPKHNLCWFAGRVLAVKLEYGLTVDPQEAAALEAMLEGCRIEHVLRPYRPEPSHDRWHRAEQLALASLQEGELTNAERYARRGIARRG